ncbi:fatty acid desaturase, partial [marine sediment metagenome]
MTSSDISAAQVRSAKDWVRILAKYREPSTRRSIFELLVTLVPFTLLWGLALAALSFSPWLTLGIAILNGFFLVRLFCIQHDCGHASFFHSRKAQNWVGRCLGVL